MKFSIDDGPAEPLGGQVSQQCVVSALASPDNRGQHLEPCPLVEFHHPVDDLLWGLTDQRLAGIRVVGDANPGVEQPQVVVDLGDGSYGGPGIPGRAFLVD